jgi:photosystem II stability/assembly factor-like uncharacterized protein
VTPTGLKWLASGVALGLAAIAVATAANSALSIVFTFELPGSGNGGRVLAVDAQGNTYAAGTRVLPSPLDFPVTDGAVQREWRNMFVAKIDPRGERFVWATYLGGSIGGTSRGSSQAPRGIAVDPQGNVAVAGVTDMKDFPVGNVIVSAPAAGALDGFLTKISADGSRFIFSTYLGGALPEAVATDPIGNTYVALSSRSRVPYETRDLSAPGNLGGTVVAKFNPAGGVVFATRFGVGATSVNRIAVDGTGAVVVGGASVAPTPLVRPITSNCWTSPLDACGNPFIARFDPSGAQIVFATFLGGSSGTSALTSLALDPAGTIVVGGWTNATDFPIRAPYQAANAGAADLFVSRIGPDGTLLNSTYVGSSSNDGGGSTLPLAVVDAIGRTTIISTSASRARVVPALDHPDSPLFISRDDGAMWTPSAEGLERSANIVAVSPADRTWYAAGLDGVFRSVDGGATWTRASDGIAPDYDGSYNTTELAIDPAHSGTLYASTTSGTYRSQDRATTWRRVDSDRVVSLHVQSQLAVDGNGWVYLGTNGIRRSRDGGATWTDLSQGLDRGPTGQVGPVTAIVFDPNVAGAIYTIVNGRLYRTTDAGESWQVQSGLFPTGYFGIAAPPGRRARIFASGWDRVFRSDTGVDGLRPLDVSIYRAAFAIDLLRPDTMFAFDSWVGTPVAISRDGGDTWQTIVAPAGSPRGPTFDPLRPATIFLPAAMSSVPYFIQFDAPMAAVRYASYVRIANPLVAAVDPAGSIYVLHSANTLAVTKLLQP